MKSLSEKLKDLISKEHKKTLVQLFTQVLNEYLSDTTDSEMKDLIERYLPYLKSAKLGKWVDGFGWPATMSSELHDLLKYVLIREQAMLEASDPILLNSQNTVASGGFSAQVLFEQSCRLEKCLHHNEILEHQTQAVSDQITTWGAQLYRKFAEMILESDSEEELAIKFKTSFVKSECTNVDSEGTNLKFMTKVYERLLATFTYLKKDEVLKDFYLQKSLYEKYDFMLDYCEWVCEAKATAELRAVAEALYNYIPVKAYQPCQKRTAALISDTNQAFSVAEVYQKLAIWSRRAWRKHRKHQNQGGETDLWVTLNDMMSRDRKHLEAWEEIVSLVTKHSTKKAAYEIFAYRFATSDPDTDPHALLKALKPVVVPPREPDLISLSALLDAPEEDKGDAIIPHQTYTPAAEGIGIIRSANPHAAMLETPSLTDLFCDEQEVGSVATINCSSSTKLSLT